MDGVPLLAGLAARVGLEPSLSSPRQVAPARRARSDRRPSRPRRRCFGAAILALLPFVGAAGHAAEPVIAGSGVAKTETRQVASFRQVRLSGPFEAIVVRGGAESLTIRADDNLLEHIRSETEGGTLHVYTRRRLAPKTRLVVEVSARNLDGFFASGATKAALSGIAADRFAIEASGAANIAAAGRCGAAVMALSGAANLNAAKLICERVEVEINGVGEASVHASAAVAVRISGVGKVVCYGNPTEIRREIFGIGRLELVR
jgi:hypothetical protein